MLYGAGRVAPRARDGVWAFVSFGDALLDFLETCSADGVLDDLG